MRGRGEVSLEVGSSVEGRLELQAGRRMARVGRCLGRSATSPAATRRRSAWRAVAGRAGGSLGGGGRGGAGRSAGTGRPGEPAYRGTVSVGREQLLLAWEPMILSNIYFLWLGVNTNIV